MSYQSELELFHRGAELMRRLYNCHICVHDFSGQIIENVEEMPVYHLNPFCSISKRSDVDGERRCIMFDRSEVARRLARKTESFWKMCPYGIVEAVIPVFMDNRNIGVLFIGPFKPGKLRTLPKNSLIASSFEESEKITKLSRNLPELELSVLKELLTMGELLASLLEKIISKSSGSPFKAKDRKQQIEDFFDENFHRNISLTDLAERLCLSESRTFQVLKQHFKCGFSTILMEKRLQRARKLLKMSMFPVKMVATMTGFRHSEYFCRVFKREYGVSPREYRMQCNLKDGI